MVRLRNYGDVIASPGGRSFYSNPRKRTRRPRKAPITPALKEALAKQREARRTEYTSALRGAQDTVQQHAIQLRETFGGHSTKYYAQEILQRGRLERSRRKPSRWNAYLREELRARNAVLPVGQPKLKSNDIVGEVSKTWNTMDPETKATVTDPLMQDLVASREEADTGAKIAPVHVLNDVSATMARINNELDALYSRTGFETIVFGVRSSADHYTAPMVHATSPKIPSFFDLVVKKPVTDLATSIEAFCLSGVDGVIGKLVKHDSQLRGDVVSLINSKLRTISKQQVNRMIYKNFEGNITRKHGIVIEGWPLSTFDNPSSIGSQVELKVLLNAWQTGATRFRKMTTEEHMAWVEEHAKSELPSARATHPPPAPSQPPPPAQHNDHDLGPAMDPPALDGAFSTIQFEPPTALPGADTTQRVPKKSRKVRSDKGKPRKRTSQIPGVGTFHAGTL